MILTTNVPVTSDSRRPMKHISLEETTFSITPLFLRSGLDGGFGDLASLLDLDDRLDDADGDGLSHVTDGETSERWVVAECLDAHWLGWHHLDDCGWRFGQQSISVIETFKITYHHQI